MVEQGLSPSWSKSSQYEGIIWLAFLIENKAQSNSLSSSFTVHGPDGQVELRSPLPGRFNVWGTLLAIFVLATGVQGLQLVSGASWLNDMFNGVALIIAVALSIQRAPSARWARLKARFGRGSTGEDDSGGSGVDEPPQPEPAPAATAGAEARAVPH